MATTQQDTIFTLYRFYDADDALLYVGLTRAAGRHVAGSESSGLAWQRYLHLERSGSREFLHFICNSCRKRYPGFADYPRLVWRDGKPHLR